MGPPFLCAYCQPPPASPSARKSLSRRMASTSTGAPLPMCSYLMHKCQPNTRRRRLVLVVSEVCSQEYRISEAREASTSPTHVTPWEWRTRSCRGREWVSLLRLLGRLLLAGLSWDHGTSLYDEIGGIPDTPFLLSLRLWFRHAPIMPEL
jgi:hypothetical protein